MNPLESPVTPKIEEVSDDVAAISESENIPKERDPATTERVPLVNANLRNKLDSQM